MYEAEDGSLQNVGAAVSRSKTLTCSRCDSRGASIGCCHEDCAANYHFSCGLAARADYKQDKTVTRDYLCMGRKRKGSKNDNHVELVQCDGQDHWDYNVHNGLLRHEESDLCLKVTRSPLKLWLKPCNSQDTEQRWFFTEFDDQGVFISEEEDESTPRSDL